MANTKIYKDQTDMVMVITTLVNFNEYPPQAVGILYKTPSGIEGEWQAIVVPGSEASGSISVTFNDTIKCNEAGVWEFQPAYYGTDGTIALGAIVKENVRDSLLK